MATFLSLKLEMKWVSLLSENVQLFLSLFPPIFIKNSYLGQQSWRTFVCYTKSEWMKLFYQRSFFLKPTAVQILVFFDNNSRRNWIREVQLVSNATHSTGYRWLTFKGFKVKGQGLLTGQKYIFWTFFWTIPERIDITEVWLVSVCKKIPRVHYTARQLTLQFMSHPSVGANTGFKNHTKEGPKPAVRPQSGRKLSIYWCIGWSLYCRMLPLEKKNI